MRSILILLLAMSVNAQLPDPELTTAERRQIAEAFATSIETRYVLEEPAKKMAAAIREHIRRGDYDNLTPAEAFVERLVRDVRAVHNDRHLRASITTRVIPADHDPETPPAPAQKAEYREQARRNNFGLTTAKILEGNVGYLDVEVFPPLEFAKPTYDAAMAFLANTDALIIDARRHRGGEPGTVAYLVSWFVPEGSLINETFTRNGAARQFRAGKLPGPRYDKKVWVLTSKRTFSGGEELAYDLQAFKRATLVGEVTGGGAHPTRAFRIHERFLAFIPSERSVNPITKTNWEGTGVKPDIEVPADKALDIAHAAALGSADKSPARDLLEAWVKSFNEHDLDARRAWLRANTTLPDAQIEQYSSLDRDIRRDEGPLEIVRFGKVTPTTAEAFAKHGKSGMGARIQVELDGNKIVRVGLQPAEVSDRSDAEIANEVAKLAESNKFSGVVLLAKDGKPFLHRAFGEGIAVSTPFNLASVNKMWTMAAIARLASEGKLRYDDPVGRHLPDYPNKTVREKATIEQLLTHRAGLGDYLNARYMKAQPVKLREFVPYFEPELEFEPGTSRSYSNAGYIVLGLIIEKLTGRDYFDYINDTILRPLGMSGTSFAGTPHNRFIPRDGSSAGGAWSTAVDMLKFAEWLRKQDVPIGMPRDGDLIGHSGGIEGASTDVYTYPKSGYTVVVLSNLDPPASHDVARLARRLIEAKGNQAGTR